jgi:hypothetical protein
MESKFELVVGDGIGSVTGKRDANEFTEVDFSATEGILSWPCRYLAGYGKE